jgi:hypothetical protein
MKFLCVPCDEAMRLEGKPRETAGSMALVYACPKCGYEFAMLTNPHETQVVGSLGVRLGAGEDATESRGGKCPFTAMVREAAGAEAGTALRWTEPARARLEGLPEALRPVVRSGIESFARERGYEEIDERVLDEARTQLR